MADKTYSFQGLSFSDQYCKQKLQDVLLLYTYLIGMNIIIIIITLVVNSWSYTKSVQY